MAATPLGRDENGKNLVAYIVRTDEEAPRFALPQKNLANSNRADAQKGTQPLPDKEQALALSTGTAPPPRKGPPPSPHAETSARFITPEHMLSRMQHEQLAQLRAREADIREDADALEGNDTETLLTSFVFGEGPDGRRYILGVAPPLVAQRAAPAGSKAYAAQSLYEGAENIHIRAANAYRSTHHNDAEGPKAGLIDRAL